MPRSSRAVSSFERVQGTDRSRGVENSCRKAQNVVRNSTAGVANTFFWIDPTNGIAGVFAAQVLPFVDAQALSLFQAFETAVYERV